MAFECIKDNKYFLFKEEFIKTDNNFWLVIEYCNGGSLHELFDAHPNGLAPRLQRNLMFQITDAMSVLADYNLLQSDLKPDNIMLNNRKSDHRITKPEFYAKIDN